MSCYELGRGGLNQSKQNQTGHIIAFIKAAENTKRYLRCSRQTSFTNIKEFKSPRKNGVSEMFEPKVKEGQVLLSNRERQRINGKAILPW